MVFELSNYNPVFYIVTGMHRSGTSCVAELVSSAGFFVGNNLIAPAPDNLRGFFEDREFIKLNDKALGGDEAWLQLYPDVKENESLFRERVAFVKSFSENIAPPADYCGLALKDPRLCRLLPYWYNVIPNAKLIYCIRSPFSVAKSLNKRNGISCNYALCLWLSYNLNFIRDILKLEVEYLIVNYDNLVLKCELEISELEQFLGRAVDIDIFDSSMNHYNGSVENEQSSVEAQLYSIISRFWLYLSSSKHVAPNDLLIEADKFLNPFSFVEAEWLFRNNGLKNELATSMVYQNQLEGDVLTQKKIIDKSAENEVILQDALVKAKKYVAHLEYDISSQKEDLTKYTEDKKTLLAELDKAKKYILHLERNVSSQREDLTKHTEDKKTLFTELDKTKKYTVHLEYNISEQKKKLKKYAEDKKALFTELSEKKEYIAHLERNILDQEKDLTKYAEDKEDLCAKLGEAKDNVAHLEYGILTRQEELAKCAENEEILRKELKDKELILKEWGAYIPHVEKDIGLLKEAIESHQQQYLKFKHSPTRLLFSIAPALAWQLASLSSTLVHCWNKKKKIVSSLLGKALGKAGSWYFSKMISLASSSQNAKAMGQLVSSRAEVSAEFHQRHSIDVTDLPYITISVVTHNNGRWLGGFMASLLAQYYDTSKIHLHFIDNSSSDTTWELLFDIRYKFENRFAELSIRQCSNNGFGAGHDYVISRCDTEYVLVTNVDLEFRADSILQCVVSAVNDKESVASWEFRQQPYEHPKYVDPVTLTVNWSSHACVLVRKSAYQATGGYEKRIFMYGEDVELSYRFRRDGWLLRYVPSAVVFHHTYKHEAEVKPLQFLGSVKANLLIRCRYGDFRDIAAGFMQYLYLGYKDTGFEGSAKQIRKTMLTVFRDTIPILTSRKKSAEFFPFRRFDYDMVRDGAFHTHEIESSELPVVSVITRTVEGRDGLLRQAIASVRNQTYPYIEHLIVQDGGDSACKIVSDYSQEETPGYEIRFLGCPKKGRSYVGNQGMAEAKGKYIVLLDDDDLLFPDHVEQLFSAVKKYKVAAAYSLAWEVHTKMKDRLSGNYIEFSHATPSVFRQEFCKKTLSHHNYIPIQSILFNKELFEKYGGFDESMDCLEDWVLWKKYAMNNDFVFVPKTTSLFRTPASKEEREQREQYFHQFYEGASKMYCYDGKVT